jgi:hypothetical protein
LLSHFGKTSLGLFPGERFDAATAMALNPARTMGWRHRHALTEGAGEANAAPRLDVGTLAYKETGTLALKGVRLVKNSIKVVALVFSMVLLVTLSIPSGATASPSRAREVPPAPPSRYVLTQVSPRSVAVNLSGGPAPISVPDPDEPVPPKNTRKLSGRVVDENGHGLGDAVVVVGGGRRFALWILQSGTLRASAGATTSPDGSFEINDAPGGALVAMAVHPSGWSKILRVAPSDGVVHLEIPRCGALMGHVSYAGQPETGRLKLVPDGFAKDVVFIFDTAPSGQFVFPLLPPGKYQISGGIARDIAGGVSQRKTQKPIIEAGETTTADFSFVSGVLLVVHAVTPAGKTTSTVEYTLIPGKRTVASRADLRAQLSALSPESYVSGLYGGIHADVDMQFHDREPGPYTACAEITFDGGGNAFGCQTLDLLATPDAREIVIHPALAE